jgi:hypothetical protein
MRIKSWESPRRRGRNDKGKGGSARLRQLKKRNKMLTNKLKQNQKGGDLYPLFFIGCIGDPGDDSVFMDSVGEPDDNAPGDRP